MRGAPSRACAPGNYLAMASLLTRLSRCVARAATASLALALVSCSRPTGGTWSIANGLLFAAHGDGLRALAVLPGENGMPAGISPPRVTREFRGVWVSPVADGDWPSRPGLSSQQQRAELSALFDRAAELRLNAIVFHVRTGADALYPTSRAPWSAYLSGTLGRPPSPVYDPLAFAIRAAHQRGLQLHAWFNPFRVSPATSAPRHTPGSIAHDHPGWVVRYGSQLWIDPGIPAARQAVLDAILEVVDRYDIDAVHLDDYFYPYVEERTVRRRVRRGRRWRHIYVREAIHFPDAASWRKYGRARGWKDRAAWRRANIDTFIRDLYREVKARKPWVQVGISPFGIWRPGHPAGITGLDAFNEIYADSRRWLREGWLDYLAPQLYWPIHGDQHRFTRLDAWWHEQNIRDRHIWPGIFTEKAADYHAWAPREIEHEVDTLRILERDAGQTLGHIHFRLKSLLAGAPGEVGRLLRRDAYREPAIAPPSPWLGAAVPAPPRVRLAGNVETSADFPGVLPGKAATAVGLAPGDTVPVRWWLVQVRAPDGRWTSTLHPAYDTLLTLATPGGAPPTAAAITALSRTGVASQATLLSAGAGGGGK